ncbi:MAG: hypothetical protein A3F91_00775 [Flavobacteria bacterium RIFCSPLOWO2_12_FULL_35_11]|nr:MAG: hypothetical protein A3F91_00775 [Flavobacteria bacterium RIFCSPLOWO2_12_FULL_35_11]
MVKNYPILKKSTPLFFLFFALSYFKHSVKKVRLLSLLVFVVFSFKGNAQCTITGLTVNSSTITCASLSGCSIVYVGDGVNSTTLVMNQNLDLTCLGAIQFIIRNNADIDFSSGNFDLRLAANSSIIVENGGNISAGSNCSASDLIRIGSVKVASCNGGGGAITDFPNLVSGGGYNTVNATSTIVCNPGTSTITAVKNPTPTSGTNYKLYDVATGGTAIQTIIASSAPYIAYFITPTLTSTTNYFIEATESGVTTLRRQVIVTVNPLPAAPTLGTITQPTCSTATGSVFLSGLPATGTWTLTRSPGAITSTGTGTSTTISGLAAGTHTYTVTNAAGCTSIASANLVINSQPSNNVWIGSVSTDWNNAANWCIGVPTIGMANTLDVLIPSALTTTYSPTLSTGLYGYVENILFESGSILTVEGNYLFVKTNLTLNGIIDLEDESQLLQDTGSVLDAASTGTIEIDQQGTGNSFRYNYWSSPVNSRGTKFTVDEVLRDGDGTGTIINKNITYGTAYAFADGATTPKIKLSTYWMYVLRNSGLGYSAWFRVGNTGEVSLGEGYTMKGSNTSSAEQNYTFAGKPNNGDITLPLNAGFDYLVGNPFPSAIDADQFILDNATSITGSIYFWEHYGGDTHNLAGYQGGYATYSLGGGVQASAFPGLGGGISVKGAPGRYIPVGQAFFVVGDAVSGNIEFNNGQRVFVKESPGSSVFMKSSNAKSKSANNSGDDLRPKFRIGFDAPKISHRQLLLTIDERATKEVDRGFDAEIYEIFVDDMYWILNNKKYVIQGTNAEGLNSEVTLGLQLSKTGVVTVKIDALENVDDDTSIYLKDKLTGEYFNMKDKPVQLNLTAGKYTDRFALTFKTQKLVAEDISAEVLIPAATQPIIEGIHVFMNNAIGELQIKNNSNDEILRVALINSLGQTVKIWNSNFNIRTISLPISIDTGVYIVQINTKTGNTVKKISVE